MEILFYLFYFPGVFSYLIKEITVKFINILKFANICQISILFLNF